MANYTQHYQLHQWVPEDDFLRSDFNEDLEKIDQALNEITETVDGKISIVTGSYTGDGVDGRTITLGFRPKALYLCDRRGLTTYASGYYYNYGGLALPDYPSVCGQDVNTPVITITDTGFQVVSFGYYCLTNSLNDVYYYLAFR